MRVQILLSYHLVGTKLTTTRPPFGGFGPQQQKHLSEAEYIYIIGYSLPETDSFFRHLYALGSVGQNPLRRFEVFNPDASGAVDQRFKSLLGPGAAACYTYHKETFEESLDRIRDYFPGEVQRPPRPRKPSQGATS